MKNSESAKHSDHFNDFDKMSGYPFNTIIGSDAYVDIVNYGVGGIFINISCMSFYFRVDCL